MKLLIKACILLTITFGFASAQITGTVSDPNGEPLALSLIHI